MANQRKEVIIRPLTVWLSSMNPVVETLSVDDSYYFLLLPVRRNVSRSNLIPFSRNVVLNVVIIRKGRGYKFVVFVSHESLGKKTRNVRGLSSTVGSLACGKLDGPPFSTRESTHSSSFLFSLSFFVIFIDLWVSCTTRRQFLEVVSLRPTSLRPPKHVPLFLCYFNIFIAACHEQPYRFSITHCPYDCSTRSSKFSHHRNSHRFQNEKLLYKIIRKSIRLVSKNLIYKFLSSYDKDNG